MKIIFYIISLVALALSAYTDIKYKKVFPQISLSFMAVSLLYSVFTTTSIELIFRVLFVVLIYYTYPLYTSGGDSKILMALTLGYGILFSVSTFALACLFAILLLMAIQPRQLAQSWSDLIVAVRLRDYEGLKGQTKILLVPYLTLAFIICTFIFKIL